jgi:NAD(P)-dependent dehydrogenase (short-subunit alcohol dehydrogenase family)
MGSRGERRFEGQVTIVTGGSSGIGRAACLALAAEGGSVVVVGRTARHVEETLEELERQGGAPAALGLTLDVSREQDMDEMVGRTLTRFGRVDNLVAGAGVGRSPNSTRLMPYPVAQLPTEEWDAVLDTNLKGTFLANRAVLPAMLKQRSGHIINISSARAGLHGYPFASAYSASKFGIIGLTEALAEEVRPYGLRVQALLPDITDTPLLHNTTLASRADALIPPSHVADLIVYMLALPRDAVLGNPIVAALPPDVDDKKAGVNEDG